MNDWNDFNDPKRLDRNGDGIPYSNETQLDDWVLTIACKVQTSGLKRHRRNRYGASSLPYSPSTLRRRPSDHWTCFLGSPRLPVSIFPRHHVHLIQIHWILQTCNHRLPAGLNVAKSPRLHNSQADLFYQLPFYGLQQIASIATAAACAE